MACPVGLTFAREDVCVVAKTVEQRSGQLLITEDLDPLGGREVGGEDRGATFLGVGDQVAVQFIAGPVE